MRKAAILACFDGKQKLSAVCHIMCGFRLKHCRIMDFFTAWFETPWLYAAYIALPVCLLLCAKPALKAWRQNPQAFGVLLCFFAVFWSLGAGLDGGQLGGLRYHLLGVALGSLMIGSAAAFWLAALFMLPHMLLTAGAQNLAAAPLNVLAVTLPALAVAELLRYAVRRFLPPNLFLYIFINGFFCAAAGMMATGVAITALLSQSTVFAAVDLWQQAFPVFFLISWGEAFLTGMFTAIFVALKPQFLLTFDDNFYLSRQNTIWPSES